MASSPSWRMRDPRREDERADRPLVKVKSDGSRLARSAGRQKRLAGTAFLNSHWLRTGSLRKLYAYGKISMLTIYSSHFPTLEILYALILEFLAHILFWNQKNHVDVAFILVSFTWVLFYLTLMNSNVLWSAHLFPVCRAVLLVTVHVSGLRRFNCAYLLCEMAAQIYRTERWAVYRAFWDIMWHSHD